MGVLRSLFLVLALFALAGLPCLLALLTSIDVFVDDAYRAVRRRVRALYARRSRRRLARQIGIADTPVRAQPAGPPIEQVAADLRRLRRQRIGIGTRSPVWFAAVQRAYDERLALACRELGIPEHLRGLTGVDLEIERVRVEGALQSAGLVLVGAGVEPRPDHR